MTPESPNLSSALLVTILTDLTLCQVKYTMLPNSEPVVLAGVSQHIGVLDIGHRQAWNAPFSQMGD